jgi:ATP-dependent DNA helicase PIF1
MSNFQTQYSEEQEEAFRAYLSGINVFVTGPGGTGKTRLIQRIQQDAYEIGKKIQVCAMTGCAAVLLECGAKTIHSWSGIGLASGTVDYVVNKALKKRGIAKAWRELDILVVDEVSMMSEKIFTVLDQMGRNVRHRYQVPFGGIQVIFSGDFFQLPPVFRAALDDPECGRFCFESPQWGVIFSMDGQILLKKNFRQKDAQYTKILNEIREGHLSKEHADILRAQIGKNLDGTGLIPTQLYPTNEKVRDVNHIKMLELQDTPSCAFVMEKLDLIGSRKKARLNPSAMETIDKEYENLMKGVLCDSEVKLKVGAQVMHIVNKTVTNTQGDKEFICNGAQGIVVGFKTVRRVADGLDVSGGGIRDFLVSTKVSMEGDEGELGAVYEEVPIIRFQSGLTIPIYHHEWMSEDVKGIGIRQIPLILAWAVSIHKCQGMTMTIAEIDIGSSVFEFAQSYVALSRVQTLGGLYLKSFDSRKIRADPRAVEFYRNLKEKRLAWKASFVVRRGGHEVIGREMCEESETIEVSDSLERVDVEKELVIDATDDASTVVENYMKPSVPIDPDVKVIDFSRYAYRG